MDADRMTMGDSKREGASRGRLIRGTWQLALGTVAAAVSIQYLGRADASESIRATALVVRAKAGISSAPSSQTLRFHKFRIPTRNCEASFEALAPDGSVWFTEYRSNKIGHLTKGGSFIEYQVPTKRSFPRGIAMGPSGSVWFTEAATSKVGRILPSGDITEYSVVPNVDLNVGLDGIVEGPDGAMWITELDGALANVTMSGQVTQFTVPWVKSEPQRIAVGSDGALWFTDGGADSVGRVTTQGVFTGYPVLGGVFDIASGPDGALWVTDTEDAAIFRVTTAGDVSKYQATGVPFSITSGPQNALWFTIGGDSPAIASITTSGNITDFTIPTSDRRPYSAPSGIASSPNGPVWFSNENSGIGNRGSENMIVRLSI